MATHNHPNQPSGPSQMKRRRSDHIPTNETKPVLKTTTNNLYHDFDSDSEDGGAELAPWTKDEIAYCAYKIQMGEGKSAGNTGGGIMSKLESGKGGKGKEKNEAACGEEERREKDTDRGS